MTTRSIERVLLVEDNPGDARLLREMFVDQGAVDTELIHVLAMVEAEAYLADHLVDVIVLDLGLPDVSGLDAVLRARGAAPHIPLVVLTGLDDGNLAVQALQHGAQDYLVKGDLESRGLLRALRYAIERSTMEGALFTEKELAQVTLNSIGDGVACTDLSGNITYLNVVAEAMTGWSLEEARGRHMQEVFHIVDWLTRQPLRNPMEMQVEPHRFVNLPSTSLLLRRDGSSIAVEDSTAPIHGRDGLMTGSVVILRDVTRARAMTRDMTHSAHHDFLTGLPNRMLLNDRIAQAIARAPRHVERIAVLFLDLDGFKHVNDSLGHSIGDRLLQSVAKRLVGCVREADTVSRQGGDEFVVLVSDLDDPADAANLATRILQAVSDPHSIDDTDLHITVSVGVSVYPEDGADAETLIKNADTAMYRAKEEGRQTFRFFEPAMNVRAVERQFIEESLRRAIEREEFALHYQPKVDLRSGRIIGSEALIRWTHPSRGVIPPAEFIPTAEECGLIIPIGQWALREACRQAQAWRDAGLPPATVAVNISGMEFQDQDFLNGVLSILDETGLPPALLELELTESVLMKRPESTASVLQALRSHGIQIAIDDFGTGYSSLSYLRRFEIDSLKIDQSFVRQISIDGSGTPLVTAVITIAQSLNLRVIAEGVETLEEAEFLAAGQCDEAQGYYYSHALPPTEFADLLATGIPARA